jgi:alpha-D-ribose 1-methylphosphonate 5-triphosphate synthase subunit PhnH
MATLTSMAAGFSNPVLESQSAFRATMDALANPGRRVALASPLDPPDPLAPAAAALALALLDFEVSFHLAPSLQADGEIARFLRFHTGARETSNPADASFAFLDLVRDPLDLASFAKGDPEYPDRSTTVIAQVARLEGGVPLMLAGPGIDGTVSFSPMPLPGDFRAQLAHNRSIFPLGVDLILVASNMIAALPRSTRIIGEAG